MGITEYLYELLNTTGIVQLTAGNIIMIIVGCVLLYLAIKKGFEPLLLLPIGFGAILANLPATGIMAEGGLLRYFFWGVEKEIFPPLIFLGVGAMTDFGPLLANPITILLGAAAQVGVFVALYGAELLGFSIKEAASIGIIGGADGPTAIYLTMKMAPHLLGAIAVAAYTYMSLVPIILPPAIRLLTTKKERQIVMEQLRPVSKLEKVLFPIICTVIISLILPPIAPLMGMLMLGNLMRECGVVERLSKTAANELINIVTILLALSVGATMDAASFLTVKTIEIIILGAVAFFFGAVSGVLLGKVMCALSGGKINPMIGAAGVSAVPMAARVVQRMGQKENPANFLLMHAMGPNVAGVIGTATAAGVMLALLK
ncbi:sodium ion-translocating decarboxylase subunit beta [Moorella sulfitireducens]|uniref:sodium ion-translocating decarboxylase subunit beta n=1 Tax=Neomoorella sulfitireducens TaxID=2972948 RepID=UPI0021AD1E4B|nr:sodium ion-translocating decarboxylase subunit beta [Moorella sulfitireducens]